MLAADKLQLQSQLKQQATALKEKEFNLHHSNLMTVGTQAAVLAGLDITMFIEFNPPMNEEWGPNLSNIARFIKFVYYIMIVSAFCSNMFVVSHTTALSVMGAGMALRGPDGSMMTATDGLYEERKSVFFSFGIGLACTVGSVVLGVWLLLHWEAALLCMCVTLYTCRQIWVNYRRVQRRFGYDESQTVDFSDIMDGPASIRAMPRQIYRKVVPKMLTPKEPPRRSTSAPVIEESLRKDSSRRYNYCNGGHKKEEHDEDDHDYYDYQDDDEEQGLLLDSPSPTKEDHPSMKRRSGGVGARSSSTTTSRTTKTNDFIQTI